MGAGQAEENIRIIMRIIISLALTTGAICFSDAARSQVNYDLTARAPVPSSSRNNVTEYSATVSSYRNGKAYVCTAERGDLNDGLGDRWISLACHAGPEFKINPARDRDALMRLVPVPAPAAVQNDALRPKDYFWQIDRTAGHLQLCSKSGGVDGSCIGSQIQAGSAMSLAGPPLPKPSSSVERRQPVVRRHEAPPMRDSVVATSTPPRACSAINCSLYSLIGISF
jgi:hypothetical protein